MSQYYDLQSVAASPVELSVMKAYLKNPPSVDDDLLESLLGSATEFGESYTGRAFRVQRWNILMDAFANEIPVSLHPVDSIIHVKYLVSSIQTTVPAATYYLKQLTSCAEILLTDGSTWPTDIDEREQAIEIQVVMKPYALAANRINDAIMRHVAHLYTNRGDCDIKSAPKDSGATLIYDQFRIARV